MRDEAVPEFSTDLILPHSSHNPTASQTVLLVHGAFSSRSEWRQVSSRLCGTYHVLIPDLPAHGESLSLGRFNVDHAARLLASLIRKRARGGKAHIIGMSLGAHVVARLAAQDPDTVLTVFTTGYNHFEPPDVLRPLFPPAVYMMQYITGLVPRPVIRYLMDNVDIEHTPDGGMSLQLCRDITDTLLSAKPLEPIPARALIVAATKGGLVPSGDSIADAKRLYAAAKQGSDQSRVVQHRRMRHPWNVQDPDLFARAVDCWIRSQSLPHGFEDIC